MWAQGVYVLGSFSSTFQLFRRYMFVLFCVVCCFCCSADSAVVEVLQPANLSHVSLVFGPCADHFASIKDLRQEHVTELTLRQYTESGVFMAFYGILLSPILGVGATQIELIEKTGSTQLVAIMKGEHFFWVCLFQGR